MEKDINRPYSDKIVESIGFYIKEMYLYNHIHPRDFIRFKEIKDKIKISVAIDDCGCDFEIDKKALLFFLNKNKRK